MPADPLDAEFRCCSLHCTLAVRVCLARQAACRRTGTQQTSRGQGWLYPSCARCPQGRALAASTPGAGRVRWRGAWFGGRFARDKPAAELLRQAAAEERLRAVGLLDEVPTFDHGPPEREGEG